MGFFDWFRQQEGKEEKAAREALRKATRSLDVDVALAAHENWKIRLDAYLAGESSDDFDPKTVASDQNCDLGKWIYGDGETYLGEYVAFEDLKAVHKQFHYTASSVISLVRTGRREEASRLMQGDFTTLSKKIRSRLIDLKHLADSGG